MMSAATSPASADGRNVIVGTAGHIDHGKTTLVHALTGTDTDRLPEEKRRGITIDLGFASLALDNPLGGRLNLSLIDVPGHHAFIRNMLAGAGGIDCVMLVIAADEGIKAQTQEHLSICSLLGISKGVVALTKIDAVNEERLRGTVADITQFTRGSFLEGAPIVPVSAMLGAGLARLKTALAEMAGTVPRRSSEYLTRLPLDRSFTMRGFGTVVTGTLQSGMVRAGDALQQHPAGRVLRVRGVQVHGAHREAAYPPCRVALNLAGVEVGQIGRGDVLTAPGALCSVRTIDAEFTMLPDAPALKHGKSVRVHAFSADTLAKVLLFEQEDAHQARTGLARLQLAEPLLVFPGDRIVLRQCSPATTIGGATILDIAAFAGRKRKSRDWLRELAGADPGRSLFLRVSRHGIGGIAIEHLQRETGLTVDTIRGRLAPLIATGELAEYSGKRGYIAAAALKTAVMKAEEALARPGTLALAELRSRCGLSPAVFELTLKRMTSTGSFEISGDSLRRNGAGDTIPDQQQKLMQSIERIYASAGLCTPLLSDVTRQLRIAPSEIRELLTLLLRAKRLVRMGADDAFVHPSALDALYGKLRKHRGEPFDVGRFKAFTGLTRKNAIPLLEHLDQARITRNHNGVRIVL